MDKGLAVVFVLALIVFVIPFRMEDAAHDRWMDDRGDVAAENAGRLGTGNALAEYPDAPLIVAHTGLVAFGAALVVFVIGTIIVLLFVIASGTRRS